MLARIEPTLWDQAVPEVRQLRELNSPVYALLVRLSTRLNLREQEIERLREGQAENHRGLSRSSLGLKESSHGTQ